MYKIIQNRKIFLTVSGLLVVASIAAILVFGLKQGIDFEGGTLWQIKLSQPVSVSEVREFIVTNLELSDFTVTQEPTTNSLLLRLPETDEATHVSYLNILEEKFGQIEELRFESIGPVVGEELRRNAVWAFLLVLLTISLYVAFVFRKVSHPVSSWKYGLITLATLFHDAIIPIGMTAWLGVEVGVNLVVAILVVIGFSVHDTIVVLDRTRENLKNQKGNLPFADLVNQSVNQTLARSINTSLTLVFILLAMYFFGPASLSYFILVILVGTIIGTYSSICVASSLVVAWQK
ncbi:MAG: protein translocase subunit SecF [Patescibacteria group bacterium]